MLRRPPGSTQTDTHLPNTHLYRSCLVGLSDSLLPSGGTRPAASRISGPPNSLRKSAPPLSGKPAASRSCDPAFRAPPAVVANHGNTEVFHVPSSPVCAARLRACAWDGRAQCAGRSEEHTSELQSLMRISYAVFCLKKKTITDGHDRCETAYAYHTHNTSI